MERAALEEQFYQAQKMESVGRLAGGVAHDFNNILTVIGACADFIEEDLDAGHPLLEDVQLIKEAYVRAKDLTRQMLAFSRKQMLAPSTVNLNNTVTGTGTMLTRLIGEDVEVHTVLADDMGNVFADAGQLEQVLVNLVVNARDAMPMGGQLTIETAMLHLDHDFVAAHPDASVGPYVRLTVSDTGVGMDEDTKARLFDPFFTTKEQGKGTGLGLATVYGIINQSGGLITVESEPGEGTTFHVYLPQFDGEEIETQQGPPSADLQGHELILVVEDEDAVRRLTRRILESSGYRVLTARNAQEAIQKCEESSDEVGLVITDVIMPKMSGRHLADHLKQTSPDLMVLFMSGYTDNIMANYGVLDAGTHFINKPFDIRDLLEKVRSILDSPRTL